MTRIADLSDDIKYFHHCFIETIKIFGSLLGSSLDTGGVLLFAGNNKSLIKWKTIKEKYFPVTADADRIVVGIPAPLSVKYPTTFN